MEQVALNGNQQTKVLVSQGILNCLSFCAFSMFSVFKVID